MKVGDDVKKMFQMNNNLYPENASVTRIRTILTDNVAFMEEFQVKKFYLNIF